MSESQTIAVRTLYPNDEAAGDGNVVTHVEPKAFLPRLGRILWPGREGEKPPAPRPVPRIPPEQELSELETLLPHLESQLAAAQRILEADPRPYATAPQAVRNVSNNYREQLAKGIDVAAMPFADMPLLRDVLHTIDGRGMLDTTAARIRQLTEQLRVPEAPKGQHKKLIVAAETALRNFGLAYRALRAFEAKGVGIGQRHRFQSPRPTCGMNFGQLSETELRKAAEFGEALPVESK